MKYNIKLESFEGPMELLMYLIDNSEIDIYDININDITEQYIKYITSMNELDLEITSEFLVMAATLLEIKSKMLLPQENPKKLENQSETEWIDPRLDLVRKLIEYRKYRYISIQLKKLEDCQKRIYFKPKEDLSYYTKDCDTLEKMDLKKLVQALNNLMTKNKGDVPFIDINKIQREEYNLEDYIVRIKNKIKNKEVIKFNSLFDKDSERAEIIIIFLSLLELIKTKIITIKQDNNFSDILIINQTKEDE